MCSPAELDAAVAREVRHIQRERIYKPIRTVARERYAWPGGYPLALLMDDGELICAKCTRGNYRLILTSTRDNDRDGWTARGLLILEGTHEDHDNDTRCANCYHDILKGTT